MANKKAPLFLSFILISSLMLGLINVSYAQVEKTDYINLFLNRDFGFRGQKFTVAFESNLEEINLLIIDPLENEIFNKIVYPNNSQIFTIQSNAKYGTYRVIGMYGYTRIETWFSVISIEDLEPVTFPYKRTFKNMNISFYRKDWTFKVESVESTFNVTLNEFKKLAEIYDFNVVARANDNFFIVRMSRDNIVNDISFMFYHKGIKWSMNGTLDQPRQFEITVNSTVIKRFRDEIRLENLRMDMTDLRKSGISFSYNKGKLIIDCKKSYYIDPIIFIDGFETGDFSEFDSIQGSPTIVTSPVYTGTYAMAVNADWEFVAYQYLPLRANETYLRAEIHWGDAIPVGGEVILLRLNSLETGIVMVKVRNFGGTIKWGLRYRENGGYSEAYSALTNPVNGTWYTVQVYFKGQTDSATSTLDAECGLWVEGANLTDIYKSGYDSDVEGADNFYAGLIYKPAPITGNFTFDDILVDNETFIPSVFMLNATNPDHSLVLANNLCTFSIDLITDSVPAYYWFSHNASGSWVNESVNAWDSNGKWTYDYLLPSGIGIKLGYQFFANASFIDGFSIITGLTTITRDVSGGFVLIILIIPLAAALLILGTRRRR